MVAWLLAGLLLCSPVLAVTPDAVETWDTGATESWVRWDPLNQAPSSVSNPTNYLRAVFGSQTMSVPQMHILRADTNASSGVFVGDYWDAAITNATFDLYCESHIPKQLSLYFYGAGRWWGSYLPLPGGTGWTHYDVPVRHGSDWRFGGEVSAEFKAAMKAVEWIGLVIERNVSLDSQAYGLDNFSLHGASDLVDTDEDGMTDWAEFIAGTLDGDSNSVFAAELGLTNAPSGFVLMWASAADRVYGVNVSTNLAAGFVPEAGGITATPPVNVYIDADATNGGPYFYEIEVEE